MRYQFRNFIRFGKHFWSASGRVQQKSRLISGIAGYGLGNGMILSLSLFGSAKKKQLDLQPEANTDTIIREADLLYDAYLIDNAYNVIKRHRLSENPEILWRMARVICEQGKQSKNPEEKNRLFLEAFEYAKKAVNNASGSSYPHKWYAIMLSYVSEIEGKKAQLAKAPEIKEHFERALEINPLDATVWHSLGVWHFKFADLSTYERWGASIFFSTPPQSSYDEALRYLERAEAIKPNFYSSNNYYLGLTYERLNRKEQALEQFKNAFAAPVISIDDMEIHKMAFERLRRVYKIDEMQLIKEEINYRDNK